MASVTSDALPDETELELISQLRRRFKTELDEREKKGELHEALFGDLAFTRILRQNKHDLEASCNWIDTFFGTFEDLEGDKVFPELLQRVESVEKEERMIQTADLPGINDVDGFVSLIYNLPSGLTKTGDPLSFYPLGGLNKQRIMARGAFDRYERFVLHGWLLRAIELDMMSRRQGRLCRVVNVIDVSGCPLSKVICKDFDQRAEKMIQRLEKLVPDLTAGNWVINAPWMLQKIFPWAKRSLRIKVDNWFLCNGDGQQDENLLQLVDAAQIKELNAFRYQAKEETDQRDADFHYISRGQVLEKAMEVRSGQGVWWKFVVLPGGMLLPPPEVRFSVVGIWDEDLQEAAPNRARSRPVSTRARQEPERAAMVVEDGGALDLVSGDVEEDDYEGLQEEVLKEVEPWNAVDGENCGEVFAPKAGLVVLRWSNEFNVIRAKRVQFEAGIKEGE